MKSSSKSINSKKNKSNVTDDNNTLLINNYLNIEKYELNIIIRIDSYDPRNLHNNGMPPLRYGADTVGGIPPDKQLLKLTNQLYAASRELLNFGYIPQYTYNYGLIIITNILLINEIDFFIDNNINNTLLFKDLLIEINPMNGRIKPNKSIIIKFKLNSFCQPIIINDIINIHIREVLKTAAIKRTGANDKLLDKIRSKKVSFLYKFCGKKSIFSFKVL